MAARVAIPDIENRDMALPMVLLKLLPAALGALALAAVFSTEVDPATPSFPCVDAASQDFYKRFVAPTASYRVLRVALAARLLVARFASRWRSCLGRHH